MFNAAFDGAEVFIIPSLWFVLLTTVVTMLITSFRRDVITVEDEDGDLVGEVVKWRKNTPRIRKALGALVLGGLVLASLVVVPPGHRGAIYTTSGVDIVERNEGYSLMMPVLHNANMVNVREQLYETINDDGEATLFAQTKDILEVPVKLGVNYTINPDRAADIFRDVGHSYEEAIIKPAVFGIATQEIGKIDAVAFPRERTKLARNILNDLRERLEPVGINVTFVSVEDTVFPESFTTAVLAKEIAEEKIEENKRLALAAQEKAKELRNLAKGEADAIREVAQAREDEQLRLGLSPTEYVWYTIWDGVLPTTLLGDGEFIVNLPN